VIEQIQALDGDFNFEVYMSLSCHNCPDVVQALNLMAISTRRSDHVVIEGGAFQDEVDARQIMAVPMVFLNGTVFGSGRMAWKKSSPSSTPVPPRATRPSSVPRRRTTC
jgi:alkyl hydroperoxide reductase subunit F